MGNDICGKTSLVDFDWASITAIFVAQFCIPQRMLKLCKATLTTTPIAFLFLVVTYGWLAMFYVPMTNISVWPQVLNQNVAANGKMFMFVKKKPDPIKVKRKRDREKDTKKGWNSERACCGVMGLDALNRHWTVADCSRVTAIANLKRHTYWHNII